MDPRTRSAGLKRCASWHTPGVLRGGIASALLAGLLLAPAAARGQGVDETCALPLTKFDPATVNVAYPDQAAVYYSGAYAAVPGTRLRITGRYPHARYMSFNVYDNLQGPLA